MHTYTYSKVFTCITAPFSLELRRLLAGLAAVIWFGTAAVSAQTPVVSAAAQQAHAAITAYAGPATCVACHQQQAQQMFGSVHYQEMAETPKVANINGPAGKGPNGGMVMNSYCGTPVTSSRATCATCHSGYGRVPSTQMTADQLNNIDCLMCHQDSYKRVPAPPYQAISFPGTNGLHTIQAPIEDETGFQYMPDTAKMTNSILEAARTVHLPTRASCLRCHAGAGGSDGGKRGDISTVTVNPPLTSDIHMSPQGNNFSCAACHSVGGHRVAGRGVDLRPNDSEFDLSCATCHTGQPHADYNARSGVNSRDTHAGRIACQTCHIPTYAKDKSTEMERSWTEAHFSMAACRGQGGWIPSEVRATNVVPIYRWFDGTSIANILGQAPIRNAGGEYMLAWPNGSVQTPASKLFPMKLHKGDSAMQDATGLLIPHSTFSFFTSGDFAKAVQDGQMLSGLTGPASVVPVQEYQTINHGVEASTSALGCGACHSAYPTGGPRRMNLQGELGYAVKGTLTQVCSQCHGSKSSKGFQWVHDYHVRDRGYDCSSCHNFSRPERGLNRIVAIKPAAPSGPVATMISATDAQILWADNSTTEQGFRIERSADGVAFAEIGTVSSNVTAASTEMPAAGATYFYRVRAYNSAGNSDYSQVGRISTLDSAPPTPPAVPTGLTATAGNQRVTLGWTASTGAASYNLKRATSASGPFTTIASATTTSYADTAVVNGTAYYYVVSAVNAGGESANSSVASAMPQMSAPPTPTGLTAAAGNQQVALAWTASSGATLYNVKRATSVTGPFTTIAGVSATSYSDTSVVNGTTYHYMVSAVNAGGESANSSTVSATPQMSAPATPTGLTATAGNQRVTLGWTASTGAASYNVKRATSAGGPFTTVASATTTSYADTAVVNGTTYYYVVSAVNAGGESANSSVVNATPQVTAPATPVGLIATAGNQRVTLGWTASTGAASYNIKRATSASGPFTTLASPTATSYADTAVVNGTTYYYVVSAVNAGGESANSSIVSAMPQVSAPPTPTGLTAAAGNQRVTLAWTASTGAASYNIKRATSAGGPFTTIASATATSYADTAVVNGTTYYYVVSAVNAGGESANSSMASATPQAGVLPLPPTALQAEPNDRLAIKLEWKLPTSPDIVGIKVYRATTSGGPYTLVASLPRSKSYTNKKLVAGMTYYYVVTAVNRSGWESIYSNQASAQAR